MTHINDSCSFGPGTTFAPFTDSLRGYEPETPNACTILQYSRIATLVHDPLQLAVQPYHFEQQMEYLAENCNVLSAEGLAYRLTRGEPFPRRSVVLMFDGGYTDLLYTAQDVLRRLSLPAMTFVPTAHLLERRPRWYDELEDLLIAHRVTGQCELIVDHDVLRLSLHSSRDRFAAYTRLVSLLSRKSPLHQQDVLQQITRALSPDEGEADSHAVLDAQQLKRMNEGGDMCIGSSTHHHVDPDTLPPWERLQEIARNKEVLEEILGRPIPFFSCPFWAIHDPPFESMALLWKLGFSFAFCNTPGSMTLCTTSVRRTFPRVRVGNWSAAVLHQQMAAASWSLIGNKVQP